MESMYSEAQKESLDLNKPLYSAAALYTACKSVPPAIYTCTCVVSGFGCL